MRRARPSKPTVWRWQARYLEEGVSGLKCDKIRREQTRLSRVPPLPRETRLKVIARTVQDSPPNATHWSRALMAVAVGISPSSVGRIRAQAGLKPHLTRGFKVSNDPLLEEKVTDIVGLCLDPPERAVVLCVDEKSRIQAPWTGPEGLSKTHSPWHILPHRMNHKTSTPGTHNRFTHQWQRFKPDDIVIMDNLGGHKSKELYVRP